MSYLPVHGRWLLCLVVSERAADGRWRSGCVSGAMEMKFFIAWSTSAHTPCCSVLDWLDSQCGERQRSEEGMQPETVSAEAQARSPLLRIKLGDLEGASSNYALLPARPHSQSPTRAAGTQGELCRTDLKYYATCAWKVRQISAHERESRVMAVGIKQVCHIKESKRWFPSQ